MIIVLQVAGVAAMLIGLATIGMGIPVKEFSFGNTMILSGTVGLCTGMLLLGLSVAALEVRLMGRRLAGGVRPGQDPRANPTLPPFPAPSGADDGGPAFELSPADSQAEAAKASPNVPPPMPEAAASPPPAPKSKRNLLFQSSMRRDRERSDARPAESNPAASASDAADMQQADFEDAWPRSERARGSDVPPTGVTVLKSGVVDGMAYSLYSDGSIEAQMPEGMMRFASIDDLRAHLDHRP